MMPTPPPRNPKNVPLWDGIRVSAVVAVGVTAFAGALAALATTGCAPAATSATASVAARVTTSR